MFCTWNSHLICTNSFSNRECTSQCKHAEKLLEAKPVRETMLIYDAFSDNGPENTCTVGVVSLYNLSWGNIYTMIITIQIKTNTSLYMKSMTEWEAAASLTECGDLWWTEKERAAAEPKHTSLQLKDGDVTREEKFHLFYNLETWTIQKNILLQYKSILSSLS